jgi:hypothetical protein
MKRPWVLVGAVLLVFVVVAAVLLQFMPRPLKDADYLVIGSVSTLVSLLTVFFMVAMAKGSAGVFLKRRKKK